MTRTYILLYIHPRFASFVKSVGLSRGTQNTVPSLSISIGGPPVAGRFCFAISRPPFHVALSRTWASVSCALVSPSLARMASAMRSLSCARYEFKMVAREI